MDQTVDPPSSLETVATDDVNLDESEEDDSFTRGRLRPWYRFGKFDKPRLEAAYRVWHHRLWMPRVKVMYLLSSVVYLGGLMALRFALGLLLSHQLTASDHRLPVVLRHPLKLRSS